MKRFSLFQRRVVAAFMAVLLGLGAWPLAALADEPDLAAVDDAVVMSIAQARVQELGSRVVVQGYVTGGAASNIAFLQDAGANASTPDAGIIVNMSSSNAGFLSGAFVTIDGFLHEVGGNLRISGNSANATAPVSATEVVMGARVTIAPIPITIADAEIGFDGMFVSISESVEIYTRTGNAVNNHVLANTAIGLRTNFRLPAAAGFDHITDGYHLLINRAHIMNDGGMRVLYSSNGAGGASNIASADRFTVTQEPTPELPTTPPGAEPTDPPGTYTVRIALEGDGASSIWSVSMGYATNVISFGRIGDSNQWEAVGLQTRPEGQIRLFASEIFAKQYNLEETHFDGNIAEIMVQVEIPERLYVRTRGHISSALLLAEVRGQTTIVLENDIIHNTSGNMPALSVAAGADVVLTSTPGNTFMIQHIAPSEPRAHFEVHGRLRLENVILCGHNNNRAGGTGNNFHNGGIRIHSGGEFTLADGGIIQNNSAIHASGGAVSVQNGGSFIMEGGLIANNRAQNGGGVSISGGGQFIMSGGAIENNEATQSGGGVYLVVSTNPNAQRPLFEQTGGNISANLASGIVNDSEQVYPLPGTLSNPYLITSTADMAELAQNANTAGLHFLLTQNIDVDFVVPIFAGNFDGGGHTITANINETGTFPVGVFGRVEAGGVIRNLDVEGAVTGRYQAGGVVGHNRGLVYNVAANVDVTTTNTIWQVITDATGGLVGLLDQGEIRNSTASGNVLGMGGEAPSSIGGLVGSSDRSSIINSHATGNVTYTGAAMSTTIGGLVGQFTANADVEIYASSASGEVRGFEQVGGLVGWVSNGSTIRNSYATGDVFGGWNIGGLAAEVRDSDIIGSHAAGNITATGGFIGGLVAVISSAEGSSASIVDSFAVGNVVSGGHTVGGLVGVITGYNTVIERSFAMGDVSGTQIIGGLAGTNGRRNAFDAIANGAVIRNSFAGGNVAAIVQMAGGLVGCNRALVENSLALGNVACNNATAGLAGGLVGRSHDETWTSPIMRNSAALNSAVYTGGTDRIGRVSGLNEIGLENNHGLATMLLNGYPLDGAGAHDGFHGAGVSPAQLRELSFWTETLGWDFDNIWQWQYDYLPALRGIEIAQTNPFPQGDDNGGNDGADRDEMLAWRLATIGAGGLWYATDGINADFSTLEFIYASGAVGAGHATRFPANVPNANDGWFHRDGRGFGPGLSGGWVMTISTTDWQELTFSAAQSSSGSGPGHFGIAYRIGTSGNWNSIEGGTRHFVTAQDAGDFDEFNDTFINVPLPATVSNQAVVQIKVYIASVTRRGGVNNPPNDILGHSQGNTSINNIIFEGVFTGDPNLIVVNKNALNAAISDAQGRNYEDYTAESWGEMQAALDNAIAVRDYAGATQQEVNNAANALRDALGELVPRPAQLPDGVLLEWRVALPDPAGGQYRRATAGDGTLEFFYANGTRAVLGRNQNDRMPINVPNNAGGWFPAGEINANTSAGWVITLDATDWEYVLFSAQQSSSNNGPSEFNLAYRLAPDAPWISFGNGAWNRVTAMGDMPGGTMGDTFVNVSLPESINGEPFVQIRIYIASRAQRSDGSQNLGVAGGNTSINNIVFISDYDLWDVTTVNKAALSAAIADALGRAQGHFTPASWQNMQNALADALVVYENPGATQADVNAANAALRSALSGLIARTPDLSESEHGRLRFIGDYQVAAGHIDGGAAEITVFNPITNMMYVVAGRHNRVDMVYLGGLTGEGTAPRWTAATAPQQRSFTNANLAAAMGIPANQIGGMESLTLSLRHEIVAIAVQHSHFNTPGWIVITDFDLNYIASFEAGIQPDFIGISPDENFIITANEGEPRLVGPNPNPDLDPAGSVTILDLRQGLEYAIATTVGFEAWDDRRDDLVARGVIMTPGVAPSLDLEPEYVAFSYCSTIAWVALQENNAIAVLDIINGEFTNIRGLGFIYHGSGGTRIDHIRGDGVNITYAPGMYSVFQPDGIAAFVHPVTGRQYLVTANEGDFRHWTDATTNYIEIGNTGRVMTASHNDGLGGRDRNVFFGTRSFSIWCVEMFDYTGNTYIPAPIFNSGSDFEDIIYRLYGPNAFNLCNENDDRTDRRSSRKGPEPEDVQILFRGGRIFAVIGIERQGGIMVYDITDPANAFYYDHINMRVIVGGNSGSIASRRSLGPEGVTTIEASQSPTRMPIILVANEVSGNVDFFQMTDFSPAQSISIAEDNGMWIIELRDEQGELMPYEIVTITLFDGTTKTLRTDFVTGELEIPAISGAGMITAHWGVHTDISDALILGVIYSNHDRAGVYITIELFDGAVLVDSKTIQAAGTAGAAFTFANIPAGIYQIRIAKPGHLSVAINSDADLANITLVPGSVSGGNAIGALDLAKLLNLWGTSDPRATLAGNGAVGAEDLAVLLANWGAVAQ